MKGEADPAQINKIQPVCPPDVQSSPVSTHEPLPMKFSGLPPPLPTLPCLTILVRTDCRERWVGSQLTTGKCVSPHFTGSNISSYISLRQWLFEFNLPNRRFPSTASLQKLINNSLRVDTSENFYKPHKFYVSTEFRGFPSILKLSTYWGLRTGQGHLASLGGTQVLDSSGGHQIWVKSFVNL